MTPELTPAVQAIAKIAGPADVAELSLADLAVLLPDTQAAHLLQLRQLSRRPAHTVETEPIVAPTWLHPSSFFWGKILSQDPTDVGNARLAVWFEATLIMATLLFSISLSLSLEPPTSCNNPTDLSFCDVLVVTDQIVWMSASLLLLVGVGILWANHMIISHLSSEEVAHFVWNNVRLTVWGVAITMVGVMMFFPGIVVRVWIVSASRTPQVLVIILGSMGFAAWNVYNVLVVCSLLGVRPSAVPFIWLSAFGVLPGSNRMRLAQTPGEAALSSDPARVAPQ